MFITKVHLLHNRFFHEIFIFDSNSVPDDSGRTKVWVGLTGWKSDSEVEDAELGVRQGDGGSARERLS